MVAKLPSCEECRLLIVSLGAPRHLVEHSALVARGAGLLAGLCAPELASAATAAGWLHDIGKTPGAVAALSSQRPLPAAGSGHRSMDHGELGAAFLRSVAPDFAAYADAVEQHPLSSVLRGRGPTARLEQLVYMADKMAGGVWLGFADRMADLNERYGHLADVRLCVAGATDILLELAARAALAPWDLERVVVQGMQMRP